MSSLPPVEIDRFRSGVLDLAARGGRLVALVHLPGIDGAPEGLLAALALDASARIDLVRGALPRGRAYPALTPDLPSAQGFEREIFERDGVRPEGHPWLKPLRRHPELQPDGGAFPFFRVEGGGLHEVAVGPVHAGIIEPGHFRFHCAGERVLHLEIHLGYQHRGAEPLLAGAAPARRLAVAESIAGDTTLGHALAFSGALEALAQVEPPLEAQVVRGVALEIERIANHVGDLGALAGDVGFLPAAAWFGRLRGEFLNLLLDLAGNRLGRGLVVPGGVRFGLSPERRRAWLARLPRIQGDLEATAKVLFSTPSVEARFESTGVVARSDAELLGLVGPAARASGCDRDVRRDHPTGIYRYAYLPIARMEGGDVLARAHVRWAEVERSLKFLREELEGGGEGKGTGTGPTPRPGPSRVSVSLVEGWRGEIAHLALTGKKGETLLWKAIDPSFHNWHGLALALRGGAISDFPLCNKSFNLSYAGHDL